MAGPGAAVTRCGTDTSRDWRADGSARHQHRFEPSLEQMTDQTVAPVEGLGVDAVEVPHQSRQLPRVRPHDEVILVAHQAVGQDIGVEARQRRGEYVELTLPSGR